MTIETHNTIGIQDIIALEYECLNCHTRTVRLLDDKHRTPALCGNCNASWFIDGSRELREMDLLVNVLRQFPQSSLNAHVAIKLEVKDLAPANPMVSGRASAEKD